MFQESKRCWRFTGQSCLCLQTCLHSTKRLLAKNKIMMNARGGDIASIDVVVPEKNTGIAPGPMLTEFKEAGIPTKLIKEQSGSKDHTSQKRRSN